MKIKLGLLDRDETFSTRLADYFDNHYPRQIEINQFTSAEALYKFLQGRGRIDILLCGDEDFEVEQLPEKLLVAFLGEEKDLHTYKGKPVVFRYQKAPDIFRALQELAADLETGGRSYSVSGRGQLFTFFGAAGDMGCSTAAMGCAARLAALNRKVIFISLQQNCNVAEVFEGHGASMSQVRYEMRSWQQLGSNDIGRLQLRLQSMLQSDPATNVMSFDRFDLPLDAMEWTDREVELLTEAVLPLCDCCILDMDGILSPALFAAIRLSAWSVLVCDGSPRGLWCAQRTLNALEVQDSTDERLFNGSLGVLYNRFGSAAQQGEMPPYVVMIGKIPKYTTTQRKQIISELTGSDTFRELEE